MHKWPLCTAFLLLLAGCNSMKVSDFSDQTPEFVLEEYFNGRTRAAGLFEDRFGNIKRQFIVDIVGTWDGQTLVLTEDFTYDDGESEQRVWTVKKISDSSYTGTTPNAVGIASGETAGNTFNWQYDFNLTVEDDTWQVHFDDWMFLQPNGVLLNKATVSRWGIKLGTVFLSFERIES